MKIALYSLIGIIVLFCACREKKSIAVDIQLKKYSLIQQYLKDETYKVDFQDTDILLQRKNLGKIYTCMYLLSDKKHAHVIDSLYLYEVENGQGKERIAFPRTPCPFTPLMDAYYSPNIPRVYANTTAERLNYLQTFYATKTWITSLDTVLCIKEWKKTRLNQKIYVIKIEK